MTSSILKQTMLSLALSASLVATASASEIVFTSGFGDTQTFTGLDLLAENSSSVPATVVQTDANNDGIVSVGDTFVETGGSEMIAYLPYGGLSSVPESNGYHLYYTYEVFGEITQQSSTSLSLGFTGGTATMTMVNNANTTSVDLFSGSLQTGACDLNVAVNGTTGDITSVNPEGSCGIDFLMTTIAAGYMTYEGDDISTFTGLQVPVFSTDLTVQSVDGLNAFYTGAGASQTFNISHDANATINVPEPTSLALLGLGLLGFGAAQRRKK